MKNKKSMFVILLLLLVGVSSIYVARTYAKYIGEAEGTGSAVVAKWAFEDDNATAINNISLEGTADVSTLSDGKIAPGTSGSFAINVNNENSEVGVDFTISMGTITDKPTNLKFYKDANHTTEFVPGTTTITGQLAAEDATGVDVTLYWAWEYETGTVTDGVATGDAVDTQAGEAATSLSIPITIKGVQVRPSTTAITSHVNN